MCSSLAKSLSNPDWIAHSKADPGRWFVGFNLYFDLILLAAALPAKASMLLLAAFLIRYGLPVDDLYVSPARLLFQTIGSAGVLIVLLFLIREFHRRGPRFRRGCMAYFVLLFLLSPTILFSENLSLIEDLRSNPFELFDWFPDQRGLILNLLRYGLWITCLLFSRQIKETFPE